METTHSERYLVELYDGYDPPKHQDTKVIWVEDKIEAHKLAVKHVGFYGDHLRFGDVLDTKTYRRVHYSWFNREFCKLVTE